MEPDPSVKLGDLVVFAQAPQPGEYGIVIELKGGLVTVLWPWGAIDCSYETFSGERWGQLRVLRETST